MSPLNPPPRTADPFRYDVAFSFLDQDRAVARDLARLLEPGLRTFVYESQQEQVGGKDGAEGYREVFRDHTRLAVILYRDGWGHTRFTGIEEAAIRDRATQTRFRSMLLVMLEPAQTLPAWVPETTIYQHGWEEPRSDTAAVIRARARDVGAVVYRPTPIEIARRLADERQREKDGEEFLRSERGATAAAREAERLVKAVEHQAKELATQVPEMQIRCERHPNAPTGRGFIITAPRRRVSVVWEQPYTNSLNESRLTVVELPNGWAARGSFGRTIRMYRFGLTTDGDLGWYQLSDYGDLDAAVVRVLTPSQEVVPTLRFVETLIERIVRSVADD